MIDNLPALNLLAYDQLLLKTMFLFAFSFALRIGEITDSQHNLQVKQIVISDNSLSVRFESYKHSTQSASSHIIQASGETHCIVSSTKAYLALRGKKSGPLFVKNNKPISKRLFSAQLKQVLSLIGEGSKAISSHSFRIGAATHWVNAGHTDAQIKRMGRWKSNAFLRYLIKIILFYSQIVLLNVCL